MDRVARVRLVRRGDGPAAEAVAGGWRVDAEADWLVEGDDDGLRAVVAALPAGIAQVWGSVVRLRLGTSVGRIAAGPLGVLYVRSGKWSEVEYEQMLDEIAAEAMALPFAAAAASALPYARDPLLRAVDVPYHAFVWLRHALLDAPRRPLLGALRGIVADPHRRLLRHERDVPVELAAAISPRTLDDVVAGRWPLQRAPEGCGVRGFLPIRVADSAAKHSVDTAENRFVKVFLELCAHVISSMRRRLSGAAAGLRARLAADLDAIDGALAPVRRSTLWREVGRLTHVPSGSSVLQRNANYREVLRSSVLLRAASRVLPLSEPELVRLLEVKDVAKLYEIWCGFHLVGLLRARLGAPAVLTAIRRDAFGANVRWGLHARWSTGVEVAVNPTYTMSCGWHGRSRSVELRPDLALFVPSGPGVGLHLFDAKFPSVPTCVRHRTPWSLV